MNYIFAFLSIRECVIVCLDKSFPVKAKLHGEDIFKLNCIVCRPQSSAALLLFLRSSGTGTEIGAFLKLFTLVTGGF